MNGTLIVSLDFELFWGMQDGWQLDQYRENILGGRKAIGSLLDLFARHNIHATWATVGMMFAESEEEAVRYFPQKDLYPTYTKPELSTYRCYGNIPAEDSECYFAADLIRKIAATPGMEIGSHTFSHYYCREAGQTVDQFEADLSAAVRIAADKGYQLSSLVLPRNQCEPAYISVLAKHGFRAYRGEESNWIHNRMLRPVVRPLRLMDVYLPLTGSGNYYPRKESGIWNLIGSRMYKPFFRPLAFAEELKLCRIRRQMKRAAKKGLYYHLWWHPHNIGVRTDFHLNQLEKIFSYYDKLKKEYDMRSLNMKEVSEKLDAR